MIIEQEQENQMENTGNVMKSALFAVIIAALPLCVHAQSGRAIAPDEQAQPWSLGLGGGYIHYEGDEATKDGGFLLLRMGYAHSPRWSFRADINYIPYLGSNSVYNHSTGSPETRETLRSSSTWAAGAAVDALFHFVPGARIDPYLVGGIGLLAYADTRATRTQADVPVRAGAGIAFRISEDLWLNLDFMGHVTIDKTEFNFIPSAGLTWKWGGAVSSAKSATTIARPAAATSSLQPATPPVKLSESPLPSDKIVQSYELDMNIDKTAWRPEYLPELDAIAVTILKNKGCAVRIEGHIEKRPDYSESEAVKLTQTRAESVREYLVKKHNIDAKCVTAVGFGFSRPKTANPANAGDPENRRMSIFITTE